LRLLFSDTQDVAGVGGALHFGVTPVKLIREGEHPGFTTTGCFPLPDGLWEIFGRNMDEIKPGSEPYERVTQWKLIRAITRDGFTFTNKEVVLESPQAAWTDNFAMAYNPEAKEYLLLNLKTDRSGFAYTGFFSTNGKDWRQHEQPLFYEGDAMSLFWSKALSRFICVSKSLQPYRKHLIDHGGPTPSLQDDALRDRRVLMLRSSPDGRRWEPTVSLSDVWNRHGRKGAVPTGFMTLPDAHDPPDLEFYSQRPGQWRVHHEGVRDAGGGFVPQHGLSRTGTDVREGSGVCHGGAAR
jgi:hypothetical protein